VAVRQSLDLLGSVPQRAVEAERIAANPARLVRRARLPRRKEVRPLAPASVERMRAAAEQRDATLFSVLAYAGLRPGEALALQWHDVRDNTILVERGLSLGEEADTKTTAHRTVRLLGPLRADLAEWRLASGRPAGHEPVFPNHRGRPSTEAAYQSWRRRSFNAARKAAGVEHATSSTSSRTSRRSRAEQAIREARSQLVPSPFPEAENDVSAGPTANAKKPRQSGASPEVELGGLEPPTSWVRSRRSPN
jgi:integrase